MSPRADNVTIYRDMAMRSLEWLCAGESWRIHHADPLLAVLPGIGLARASEEQRRIVSEVIGREVERGDDRWINVAYLRSQLRRWAARERALGYAA